jgi:hypothetical protein
MFERWTDVENVFFITPAFGKNSDLLLTQFVITSKARPSLSIQTPAPLKLAPTKSHLRPVPSEHGSNALIVICPLDVSVDPA